ncbi:MAG: hypothetical protein NY202_05180 [Mollicutes bacterium UO1]
MHEVLQANANGFYVINRGQASIVANIATDLDYDTQNNTANASPVLAGITKKFFPNRNKKYLGFPILEASQKITTDARTQTDDATHLFGKSASPSAKYTKPNIDRLRGLSAASLASSVAPIITTVPQ